MPPDLAAALDAVHDRVTFVAFVAALAADAEAAPDAWAHGTIGATLEAAAAWALDSGAADAEDGANPWRVCAQVLAMGRVYE